MIVVLPTSTPAAFSTILVSEISGATTLIKNELKKLKSELACPGGICKLTTALVALLPTFFASFCATVPVSYPSVLFTFGFLAVMYPFVSVMELLKNSLEGLSVVIIGSPLEIEFPISTLDLRGLSPLNAAKPNLISTGPEGGVINPDTFISKLPALKIWLKPSKVVMDLVVVFGSS